MADWQINRGAIVERPREVGEYPMLASVYDRHDELIADLGVKDAGRTLEVAFGTRPHPNADVGIEAYPENSTLVDEIETVTADARELPFPDESFDAVVGRRLLHHVPKPDRSAIVREAARVLTPGGRFLLLEGTPGTYRRATKGLAFRLGILGEDSDVYGHLTVRELEMLLVENEFDVVHQRSLGSPLLPLSALKSPLTTKLGALYDRTQWVRWWTLAVGERRTARHKTDRLRRPRGKRT